MTSLPKVPVPTPPTQWFSCPVWLTKARESIPPRVATGLKIAALLLLFALCMVTALILLTPKVSHKSKFMSSNECDPNVKQYSGYIEVGSNMNMFFWFFEARKNPETAPLTVWINGGPGCSSMIGLFQEIGPCRSKPDGSGTVLHPHAWNEVSNLLFIDQPIGTGFSYGDLNYETVEANARVTYTFLQRFFENFPEYADRTFHFFGESYAGHWIPPIADLILKNNELIRQNKNGTVISLDSIGIGNGWIDPSIQYPAYVDYACNNHIRQLFPTSICRQMRRAGPRCTSMLKRCEVTRDSDVCITADEFCHANMAEYFFNSTDINEYDIRARIGVSRGQPSTDYVDYLNEPRVQEAIGAKGRYEECAMETNAAFYEKGNLARSFSSYIGSSLNRGIRVLLYYGDTDFNCNWFGGRDVASSLDWHGKSAFNNTPFKEWNGEGDEPAGQHRTLGNLSFVRVYAAGHEVPFYQPENSLHMFTQWINKRNL